MALLSEKNVGIRLDLMMIKFEPSKISALGNYGRMDRVRQLKHSVKVRVSTKDLWWVLNCGFLHELQSCYTFIQPALPHFLPCYLKSLLLHALALNIGAKIKSSCEELCKLDTIPRHIELGLRLYCITATSLVKIALGTFKEMLKCWK